MKVLNLRCAHDHRFEGWFASDADFLTQQQSGAIGCPFCDDKDVNRLPSAPRLNTLTTRGETAVAPGPAELAQARAQGKWLRAMRDVIAKTEDVGDRFTEEARRIHYGEAEERGIRGRATQQDAQALRDEGIDVMPLALPESVTGSLQ
ncbi:MAG: DUF1178 family protein [Pseudomonadota bacterium]|nr:DUF1178 family protein [Pseudomonadota bacterium]